MKEFLKNNTITYNLMSFTGFKSILIFSILIEEPKSYAQIQEIFKNHEYLHENISIDAIRIYMNSLKEIGCKINKINTPEGTKYQIVSHPLKLKFSNEQIKSIIKLYKAVSKSINLDDLIALQQFFNKISNYIEEEDLKIKLKNLSPIHNIELELINKLKIYAENNTEIVILYNSPTSGRKNITLITDKLEISNNKLYVYGFSSEHNNYSSFLVSKIIKIISVNIKNRTLNLPSYCVGYKYFKDNEEKIELLNNEKIIEESNKEILIEITSKNKFDITQRLLSMTSKCKILYPQEYKQEFVSYLLKMKENYNE